MLVTVFACVLSRAPRVQVLPVALLLAHGEGGASCRPNSLASLCPSASVRPRLPAGRNPGAPVARHRMQLPEELPPSFRGTAVQYIYSLEAHATFSNATLVGPIAVPQSGAPSTGPQVRRSSSGLRQRAQRARRDSVYATEQSDVAAASFPTQG